VTGFVEQTVPPTLSIYSIIIATADACWSYQGKQPFIGRFVLSDKFNPLWPRWTNSSNHSGFKLL